MSLSNKKKGFNKGQIDTIITLHLKGISSRAICDELDVPRSRKSSVNDILARWRKGDIVHSGEVKDAEIRNTMVLNSIKPKGKVKVFDNSRILIISDLHIPYNHPDSLEFLQHLKDKYQPTRIICMGDELDKHALSYHDSDPDLSSAGDELKKSLPTIKKLETMFPEMDILDSNHGSLVWRKAKTHGIPRHYIKSYNDVLGVGEGWEWHHDLTIKLPNNTYCYFHHGKTNNVIKLSQQMGMNCVQGHYHEAFKIDYWGNPTGLYWAMQSACLIDDTSYAFSYNNVNIKRPIIGTGLIIDSLPVLEPMVLGKDGRWINRKNKRK